MAFACPSRCTPPRLRIVADFGLAVAQHGLPTSRKIDALCFEVPVPKAIVRAAGGQRITLFALAQGVLGALAVDLRPDAGQRHRKIDRLGDVVVGAQV